MNQLHNNNLFHPVDTITDASHVYHESASSLSFSPFMVAAVEWRFPTLFSQIESVIFPSRFFYVVLFWRVLFPRQEHADTNGEKERGFITTTLPSGRGFFFLVLSDFVSIFEHECFFARAGALLVDTS